MTREEAVDSLLNMSDDLKFLRVHNLNFGKMANDIREAIKALEQPPVETERKICGCGGWPDVISPNNSISLYLVQCDKCHMETDCYDTKQEAIDAWNRALG